MSIKIITVVIVLLSGALFYMELTDFNKTKVEDNATALPKEPMFVEWKIND